MSSTTCVSNMARLIIASKEDEMQRLPARHAAHHTECLRRPMVRCHWTQQREAKLICNSILVTLDWCQTGYHAPFEPATDRLAVGGSST